MIMRVMSIIMSTIVMLTKSMMLTMRESKSLTLSVQPIKSRA